ncbi:hypothetical protein, partial [Salmonella sp. s55004]|uniref:hypothetical protein n=1 Tax=Salmonella sp. s55004 TaxID=3159675 RepID=UPI00397FB2D4
FPTKTIKDNSIIVHTSDICSALNDYFTYIGPTLASSLPERYGSYFTSFPNPINEEEVLLRISTLKKSSPGFDEISAKAVKFVSSFICKTLTHIFNCSLMIGIVLSPPKTA